MIHDGGVLCCALVKFSPRLRNTTGKPSFVGVLSHSHQLLDTVEGHLTLFLPSHQFWFIFPEDKDNSESWVYLRSDAMVRFSTSRLEHFKWHDFSSMDCRRFSRCIRVTPNVIALGTIHFLKLFCSTTSSHLATCVVRFRLRNTSISSFGIICFGQAAHTNLFPARHAEAYLIFRNVPHEHEIRDNTRSINPLAGPPDISELIKAL